LVTVSTEVLVRSIAFALVAFLGMSLGCAKAPQRPPLAPRPGEIVPRDEAAAIAQEAVDGRVTMLLHLDRVRGFRFARQLAQLGAWNILAADVGIDAFEEVQRTYIAAHASHNGQVALVLQHTAPEEKVVAAIAALHEKWRASHSVPTAASPGEADVDTNQDKMRDIESRLDEIGTYLPDPARFPFPAAYRYLKNDFTHTDGPVLIAAPHPGLVILLPPERAFAAFRMIEGGGLPAPSGQEAMVFRAWDPDRSIQSGPSWSPEVRYAEAVFTFDSTGSSTLKFRAVCTSAEVAKEQAEAMTTQVEQAQTISIGGAKLRLFDFIQFRAEKDRVKMLTRLFPEDVEWLVGMTMKPL
jgi:hypothetical protein